MANDNIEIVAKLKLDTSEAENKISDMSKEQPAKAVDLKLPKNTEIKLPDKAKKSLGNLFKGDGGLENAAKVATGASKGLGGLMGSLQGVATASGAAVAALGVVAAIFVVIMKLLEGTDTLKAMQASLEMLMNAFREVLAPVLALVGEVVIVLADSLASLAPILSVAVNALTPLLNMIVGGLMILQPFLELAGKLGEVFGALSSIFSDIAGGVITSLVEIIVMLIDKALKPLFQMLDVFIKFIDNIKKAIQDFITKLTAGVIKFNKTTLASTEAVKADLKTSLDTWETSGTETATERSARLAAEAATSAATAATSAATAANSFSGNIESFLSTLGEAASDFWEDIKTAGENVWEGISSIAEGVWSSISETAEGVWNSISEAAKNVWKDIKNTVETAWESVTEFVSGLWESVTEFVSGVWSGVAETVSGIWKSVAESVGLMWKEVKEKALSVWDSIKSSAGSVVDSILATIRKVLGLPEKRTPAAAGAEKNEFTDVDFNKKTVVGTVVDKAADVAKTVGETVADWANTAVDAVTGFFGKLKFWKDGGTLSEGAQIWGMNEKGNPEFIFNAGGHDTVINSDILSDAVYSALVRADKGQELQLEVSIKEGMSAGPRELAQILLPSLQFLMKR